MPVVANPPIENPTYGYTLVDPATASPGKVKRARRVAARAKAIIEDKGWAQRTAVSSDGRVCLSEAIRRARNVTSKPGLAKLTGDVMSKHIYGVLEEARFKVTRRAPSFSRRPLADWNDKPGRTKEQVLTLLDMAANG